MLEQANAARTVLAEVAKAETIGPEERKAFRQRLREPRALLLGAALEYSLRGLSIRETAFFGGYAPLLMKKRSWRIALKPEPEPEPETEDTEPPSEP
jgi:hypothetical protein